MQIKTGLILGVGVTIGTMIGLCLDNEKRDEIRDDMKESLGKLFFGEAPEKKKYRETYNRSRTGKHVVIDYDIYKDGWHGDKDPVIGIYWNAPRFTSPEAAEEFVKYMVDQIERCNKRYGKSVYVNEVEFYNLVQDFSFSHPGAVMNSMLMPKLDEKIFTGWDPDTLMNVDADCFIKVIPTPGCGAVHYILNLPQPVKIDRGSDADGYAQPD